MSLREQSVRNDHHETVAEGRPEPDPGGAPSDTWDVFRSWHRDERLYREAYSQALGTVAGALVIYLAAALVGLVDREPATVLVAVVVGIGLLMLLFALPGVICRWSRVRPLFRVWNEDTDPEAVQAKRLYNRLIWGLVWFVMPGVLLLALLATD